MSTAGISEQQLVTQRMKQTFKQSRWDIKWLKCADQCAAMTAWNTEQLTLIQEENHITVQPNREPTFLHKFHQFYPFIQVILWQTLGIQQFRPTVTLSPWWLTSHWRRNYKVKAGHVMEILIALDKGLSPALLWKFLYIWTAYWLCYATSS